MKRFFLILALALFERLADFTRFLLQRCAAGVIRLQRARVREDLERRIARAAERRKLRVKRLLLLSRLRVSEEARAKFSVMCARTYFRHGRSQVARSWARKANAHRTAAEGYRRWAEAVENAA